MTPAGTADSPRPERNPQPLASGGHLVGPAFFLLAGWFLWGPDVVDDPVTPGKTVGAKAISTEPRREHLLGDPPIMLINGFDRTCMECHRSFQSDKGGREPLLQHTHIEVQHGLHRGCYSCHDVKDRNRLALLDESTVTFDRVVELCAQCHQSKHRDWTHGLHGRTNGYWNAELGEVRRLLCTQCHDPHRPAVPAMAPLQPLPGPNTLRMGAPNAHAAAGHAGSDERDPLRRGTTADGGKHR